MVARIINTAHLYDVLDYNEKKLEKNDASLLHASGFLQDTDRLSFQEKFQRFERMNELNTRSRKNVLHITLNFDPSDQLSKDRLIAISDRYIEGIGFGDQPYLVYQHHDAGHAHVHVVTNTIRREGSRINLHNIGRNQSRRARKAIEQEFGLQRPEGKKPRRQQQIRPTETKKVIYGRDQQTKEGIQRAVDMVIQNYRFRSLPEFNAILRAYNVIADRGGIDSRTYRNGGLIYRALDERGNKVGVPIKASHFSSKPTLARLNTKFQEQQIGAQLDLDNIRARVEWTLFQEPADIKELASELKSQDLDLVIWKKEKGNVYGSILVDQRTRMAIQGQHLGDAFSDDALMQRFYSQRLGFNKENALTTVLRSLRGLPTSRRSAATPKAGDLPVLHGVNKRTPQLIFDLTHRASQTDELNQQFDISQSQKMGRRC